MRLPLAALAATLTLAACHPQLPLRVPAAAQPQAPAPGFTVGRATPPAPAVVVSDPPPAPAVPPIAAGAAPVAAVSRGPAGLPAGPLLRPGEVLDLDAPAGGRRLVMLANPGPGECTLGVQLTPGDAAAPAPTPRPSSAGSGELRTPPFGFGFDASLGAGSPKGRRGILAVERRAYAVGDRERFWVNDGSARLEGDREREATLRHVTPHAMFFVDAAGDVDIDEKRLRQLADGFERLRTPLVRVSGEEDRPGIDGVDRLYVVISPWVGQAAGRTGMMGYFWPRDAMTREAAATDLRRNANEKEVIFLSTTILDQPEVTAMGSLAHEYQHLLTFCAKSRVDGVPRAEVTWLDEGISMVAMDLAGFGRLAEDPFVIDEIAAFRRAPGDYSLTDWLGNPNGRSYGLSYLFVTYLTERYGLGVLRDLLATPRTGIEGLDEVLAKRGSTFADAFVAWARAGGEAQADAAEDGDGLAPQVLEATTSLRVRPWGVVYLEAHGSEDTPRAMRFQGATLPLAWWQGGAER